MTPPKDGRKAKRAVLIVRHREKPFVPEPMQDPIISEDEVAAIANECEIETMMAGPAAPIRKLTGRSSGYTDLF